MQTSQVILEVLLKHILFHASQLATAPLLISSFTPFLSASSLVFYRSGEVPPCDTGSFYSGSVPGPDGFETFLLALFSQPSIQTVYSTALPGFVQFRSPCFQLLLQETKFCLCILSPAFVFIFGIHTDHSSRFFPNSLLPHFYVVSL